MMSFRGLELDFDIYDAGQAERYEALLAWILEEAPKKVSDEGMAEMIRRQCGIVFDFFDDLIGEGTHRDLFGGRTNLRECLAAFKEFNEAVRAQKTELKDLAAQSAPDRAIRRAPPRRTLGE